MPSTPHKLSQSIPSTKPIIKPVVKSTIKAISTASSTKITVATNNTSGWTTYRNKKYGFEIKLPDGWYVLKYDKGTLSQDANYRFDNFPQRSTRFNSTGFNIQILPSIGDLRADAAGNVNGYHEERIATLFHNLPAIQVNSSARIDGENYASEELFVNKGQYTFILPVIAETSKTTSKKDVRAIFSTFQFISSTTNGGKLKTYIGYGVNYIYTFQYPSNLKIQTGYDSTDYGGNLSICNEEICAKFLKFSTDSTPKKTPPPALIKISGLYHLAPPHSIYDSIIGEHASTTMYKIKSSNYIPTDCFKKYNVFSYYVASTTNPIINSMIATLKFNASSTPSDSSNRKETSTLNIPKPRTYHNDTFGFTLTYSNDPYSFGSELNGIKPTKPIFYTNSTSTITYDPVTGVYPVVYLFRDPSKFRSTIYNSSTGAYENIKYIPKNKQFVITSNAKVPECPEEQYSTKQNVPYYVISTGIHAGSTIDVYITTNGIIASAGEVYRDSRGIYHEAPIIFDNPQSVIKATYLVVPK